ncbi:unnamed protein product [Rotaria sp. Silwood1]|nr:unnamed protein product [Rotaria sp. Silwood1]
MRFYDVRISFLGGVIPYRWNTTGITILNSSQISSVSGLFFDSNDTLYIVDEYPNSVVWKLPKNTLTPILVAGIVQSRGTGASQLNRPQDVYVDSNKNMYVTDCYGHRLQKFINGSTAGVTIAGITGSNGTALNQFNCPRYFCLDPTETYLYINDNSNQRTMLYRSNSTTGTNGTIVAGGNSNGNSNIQLHYPWGIHYLPSISTDMYIANNAGHSVMRWIPGASSGIFVAGTAGVSGSNATLLNSPMGLKIDAYLNIYVVDKGNHRVQMFCQNSSLGITIVGTGIAGNSTTELNAPRSIAFDSSMNMYIGDTGNVRVQKFLKI